MRDLFKDTLMRKKEKLRIQTHNPLISRHALYWYATTTALVLSSLKSRTEYPSSLLEHPLNNLECWKYSRDEWTETIEITASEFFFSFR